MTEGPPRPPDEPRPSWSTTYPMPEPTGDIAAYLRANGTRYTREALDQRLLEQGHSPEAIAAAWATVEAEDAAAGRRDRRGQTTAIIGIAYVATWLLVTLLAIVPGGGGTYSPVALLAGVLAVALFIPGIIAIVIARSTGWLRRADTGRVVAFALVPMLILFAIAGTCVSVTQSIS